MNKNVFAIIIFLLFVLFSCNREDIIKKDFNSFEPIPPEYFKRATVVGTITDINKNPIANAEVKYGDKSILSDENGNFQIKNGIFNDKGELLEIKSPGFFNQYALIKPELNKVSQTNLICQKKDNVISINSNNDFEKSFYDSKLLCKISANSFIGKDNNRYDGKVNLFVKSPFLNPDFSFNNPSFGMPESNKGIGPDSLETIIFPDFSMLLNFRSDSGDDLMLDKPAIIEIDLNYLQCSFSGKPYLWRFDNITGRWQVESSVKLEQQNNKYIIEVKRSGYYIVAQYNLPAVSIEGDIKYADGSPAGSLIVEVLDKEHNYSLQEIVITDFEGRYFSYVYQNSDIVLRITNCNNENSDFPLGIVSSSIVKDIDLPMDFEDINSIFIDHIYNENGDVVNNGFAGILDNMFLSEYFSIPDDSFGLALNLHSCAPVLTLFDLDNLPDVKKSDEIFLQSNLNFNPADYPTVYDVDEYVYINIEEENKIFDSYPWVETDGSGYNIGNNNFEEQLIISFYHDFVTDNYIGQICVAKLNDSGQIDVNCSNENVIFNIDEQTDYITGSFVDSIEYNGGMKKIEGYFKIW